MSGVVAQGGGVAKGSVAWRGYFEICLEAGEGTGDWRFVVKLVPVLSPRGPRSPVFPCCSGRRRGVQKPVLHKLNDTLKRGRLLCFLTPINRISPISRQNPPNSTYDNPRVSDTKIAKRLKTSSKSSMRACTTGNTAIVDKDKGAFAVDKARC